MELKLVHVLGPILATVAMLFYGRILVRREKGRSVRIGPALLLIAAAISFRILFGDGTFLDRICLVLMDFGIAMIVDSAYLRSQRTKSAVFWVPGVLALLVSFGIYFVASLFGWTVSGLFDESAEAQAPKTGIVDTKSMATVLVELGPDDRIEELQPLLDRYQANAKRALPFVEINEDEDLAQYFAVTLPQPYAQEFLENVRKDKENVDQADLNYAVDLDLPAARAATAATGDYIADDPGIRQQWWLPVDKANRIHELLRTHPPQRKARVAIVDTGVDDGHGDLRAVFAPSAGAGDPHGHGTHCAGLAGAATNNGQGIASLNWEGRFIEILAFKALDQTGHGEILRVATAIAAAAEAGVDVISLSLGGHHPVTPQIEIDAIEYARKLGCIVVAAAGNDYGDDAREHSPANIAGVIAVAAIDATGARAPFSNVNTGLAMPIAAPGANIFSTTPEGKYDFKSGTSMATPIVAGLLGVLRAYNPDISGEDAWQLLHDSGATTGASAEVGHVVDIEAALRQVLGNPR